MPARLLAPAIAQIALCRAVVNIEAARFPVGRFDFALLADGVAMAPVKAITAFHECGGDVGRRGEFRLGFVRCGRCEIAHVHLARCGRKRTAARTAVIKCADGLQAQYL